MPAVINDVAKHAGVSKKTVSRVINNDPHVSDEMRDRVLTAINELDFRPNIAAKRLASNCAFTIALLYGDAPGEYFPQVINSILDASREYDYSTIISSFTPENPTSRDHIEDLIRRKAIDGLILAPPCDNDKAFLDYLQAEKFPFVRLTPADPFSPLPSIAATDFQGAYDIAEHLLHLGHRNIGFVFGDPMHHASHERFEGFRTALHAYNVPFDPKLVRTAYFQFDLGLKAGTELLTLPDRPTAIMASNDESAAGVLIAAHKLGIDVPGQLSVTGFDDFPIASKTWPQLTTVRQPMDKIAEQATHLLLEIINNKNPEQIQLQIPTTLVVRKTTAPPRQIPVGPNNEPNPEA